MVANFYEALLTELSEALEIEKLIPDENNSCLIRFKNGLEIQIEPQVNGESLVISAPLGEVPPGKYREDVFREALKANATPYPRQGTFGYSLDTNQLILFKLMPFKDLTGDKVAAYLNPFMEKAIKWREMLEKGEVPHIIVNHKSKSSSPFGMFGGLT
ncbi:MAG: CesT family type III secretion system chaperone [Waddliaceae bacterium]